MTLPMASEMTQRRTATVTGTAAVRVHDALAAMDDVAFGLAFHRLTESVTFTVECGAHRLDEVAAVFRELGGVVARS